MGAYWSNNSYSKDFFWHVHCTNFLPIMSQQRIYCHGGPCSFTNTANIRKSLDMTHAKLSGQAGRDYQATCTL